MLTKTVYRYDNATKEYLGEAVARESPRRPGTFLIPADTTEKTPPDTLEREVAVFDETTQGWVIKADYRSMVYYDTRTKEKQTIQDIGVEPVVNWTHIAPTDTDALWTGQVWEVPFEIQKERKKTEILTISAAKMSVIEEGYSLGEVKTFEQQYVGAVEILNGNTETVAAQFVSALAAKRSEVGGVEVTPEQLAERIIANYLTAKEYTAVILGVQQGLETRVQMATSQEALQAIQWPEII